MTGPGLTLGMPGWPAISQATAALIPPRAAVQVGGHPHADRGEGQAAAHGESRWHPVGEPGHDRSGDEGGHGQRQEPQAGLERAVAEQRRGRGEQRDYPIQPSALPR